MRERIGLFAFKWTLLEDVNRATIPSFNYFFFHLTDLALEMEIAMDSQKKK